jgi:hypothetical protein
MSFEHYHLLLTAIEHGHARQQQPAYLRIVRREPRPRRAHGRPRSLPRGRPVGPPDVV